MPARSLFPFFNAQFNLRGWANRIWIQSGRHFDCLPGIFDADFYC